MVKYGYARVSTYGQDLDVQIEALEREGCDKIYSEHYTGTKTERPEFQKLIDEIESGDMLVVTKLDRIARSAMQGSELVKELIDKGVRVNIINMGIMDNTPGSNLVRNIFFSFAEYERDLIIERTQEGKAIARQREGFREGRPKKFSKKQLNHAMLLKESGMSYKQVAEMTGISKSTLAREYGKYKAKESI